MNTVGLMNYIERLRYSRNMTQEEFLHDIVSPRQYQRYRNGENDVPMECIEKLSEKLGVATRKLFLDYEQEKYIEKETVEEFYNSVVYKNFGVTKTLIKHFKKYDFLDNSNKEIFEMAITLNEYLLNNMSKSDFIRGVSRLINYENVLKYKVLRDVEIIGLMLIYQHGNDQKGEIIEVIKRMNENQDLFLSGQSFFVLILFIYYIALDYGKNENYSKAEDYSLRGIRLLKKKHSNYCLYLFYYQLALVKHHSNDKEEFEKYVYKCIIQLKSMHNDELYNEMKLQIKKYTNLDSDIFLSNYLQKTMNK